MTVRVTPEYPAEATCPKCGNRQSIETARPSAGGNRRYDILSDTWGVARCPACGHRGAWIDFHRPIPLTNPTP